MLDMAQKSWRLWSNAEAIIVVAILGMCFWLGSCTSQYVIGG